MCVRQSRHAMLLTLWQHPAQKLLSSSTENRKNLRPLRPFLGISVNASSDLGPMGDAWKADKYSSNSSFVFTSVDSLLDLLDPQPGECILDVGCGSGELTRKLMEQGCVVVGIDSSSSMVESAKEKGVDARLLDVYDLSFEEEFDAVFSNAALHWMSKDPPAVLRSALSRQLLGPHSAPLDVCRSLKPWGRFVLEMGAQGNVASIEKALGKVFAARGMEMPNYWYFPSRDAFVELLEAEGFEVNKAVVFARPTPVPAGIAGWLEALAGKYMAHFDEAERAQVREEVVAAMEPLPTDSEGKLIVDYVRLMVHATRRA